MRTAAMTMDVFGGGWFGLKRLVQNQLIIAHYHVGDHCTNILVPLIRMLLSTASECWGGKNGNKSEEKELNQMSVEKKNMGKMKGKRSRMGKSI